jgi:putative membrane protein
MNAATEFLSGQYQVVRGLHILAVIAWMAGLLYLPRLFVYHTRAVPGSEIDVTFQSMETKLFGFIMNPSMLVAWTFGLCLIGIRTEWGHDWGLLLKPWMLTKLVGVVFQTSWHSFLGQSAKAFARGRNTHTERFWRMVNELPFLAAIVMVLAVTTEFGG